jgi:hypothetical protein
MAWHSPGLVDALKRSQTKKKRRPGNLTWSALDLTKVWTSRMNQPWFNPLIEGSGLKRKAEDLVNEKSPNSKMLHMHLKQAFGNLAVSFPPPWARERSWALRPYLTVGLPFRCIVIYGDHEY